MENTESTAPDNTVTVPLPGAEPKPKTKTRKPAVAAGPQESANIVALFNEEEQKKLAETVINDFDADLRSRSGRMRKCKEFTELYAGLTKPKMMPFQNCANVNLNVLSYTSLQVHARLFDMIWPDNGKVVYSAPSNIDDFERAQLTEKYANSRIRNNMPEMAQGLDDTLAQLVIYGSAVRRTYWDTYEWRERSDWVPIEDFVVAHEHRSQDPSMRDVPRYTMVTHPTLWELKRHEGKVYENVKGIKADERENATSEMAAATQKIDGVTPVSGTTDEDRPRMVLEQHRTWQLPNRPGKHPAFDGQPHYVIVTVDKQSQRVLRMALREEDDPEDVKRYEREKAETGYDQYLILKQAYDAAIAAAQAQAAAGLPDAQLPLQPTEVQEPAKPRKRQLCFFTHYRAFPSEGFYGLGFGDFVGPLNKAANIMLNQHIDGVTLRNSRPGFISRQMRMQRGTVNVKPGELVEVDAPAAAIKEGIVWLDPPLNDPTTMPIVNLLVQMADKFAGSSDIMSGATSGANRTAKEIQILNAQLMKQISVLAKRVREALKHEFDKLWRLWGTFLPDEPENTDVIDPMSGSPDRIPISRKMFVPDARVFPAADPRLRFEKVEETMQSAGVVMQTPMLAQNPAIVRAVIEDVLRVHDKERLIPLLGPPPGPPEPPKAKATWEEEAGWLREEDSAVHPDDNDDEHVMTHMAFLQSPRAQMMSKNGRDMAERHLRFHQAQAVEKANTMPPPGMPGMPGMPMPGGPPPMPMGGMPGV